MPLHIIIDGYNLIRQSKRLSAAEAIDLQAGREALIDALAHYKRIKAHRITVVFDGTGLASLLGERDRAKGIDIRFSRGRNSRAVIKRRRPAKSKTMAVSSIASCAPMPNPAALRPSARRPSSRSFPWPATWKPKAWRRRQKSGAEWRPRAKKGHPNG
jgi:hypothetical protein